MSSNNSHRTRSKSVPRTPAACAYFFFTSSDENKSGAELEREKVVQEFFELWSKGLADAGVSPQKIYSHTCFLSRRAFNGADRESHDAQSSGFGQ